MIITSSFSVDAHKIIGYRGIVTAIVPFTFSSKLEKTTTLLVSAKNKVNEIIEVQANEVGANAIIGLSYQLIYAHSDSPNIFVTGTAVVIERE